MANTTTTGKTLQDYIREAQEAEARATAAETRVKQLESAQKLTLSFKVAKHGMGAVSMSGLQRFPLSLHAAQWPDVFVNGPAKFKAFLESNADEIRCANVAVEYAIKVTGFKSAPEKSDPTRKAWEQAWDTGFNLAKSDTDLQPSNPKYRSPAAILATL